VGEFSILPTLGLLRRLAPRNDKNKSTLHVILERAPAK